MCINIGEFMFYLDKTAATVLMLLPMVIAMQLPPVIRFISRVLDRIKIKNVSIADRLRELEDESSGKMDTVHE